MAVYRAIYMSFWTDTKVDEDYAPEDKYFMLYVLTNPHTNLCGCYEVSLKQMAQEMGYPREKVEEILVRFSEEYGTVLFNKKNRELFVKNWYKYNWTKSPKLDRVIRDEILHIKTQEFKDSLMELFNERISVREGWTPAISEGEEPQDVYEIDSASQLSVDDLIDSDEDEPEEKQSQELVPIEMGELEKAVKVARSKQSESNAPCEEIKELFNSICVSFPPVKMLGGRRKTMIGARWRETGENIEVFRELFEKMQNSDFLRGVNDRGWQATFDWAILPSNFQKILEGNYVNKRGKKGSGWDVIRNAAMGGQK